MFPSLFTGAPHVKSGKLKGLAIAGPKRSPLLPEVSWSSFFGQSDS
jgi:hypothetical protein